VELGGIGEGVVLVGRGGVQSRVFVCDARFVWHLNRFVAHAKEMASKRRAKEAKGGGN